MMWLVAYDISDDAEREKVAALLQAMGFSRVQRSVFVGRGPRGRVLDALERAKRVLRGRHHVLAVPVQWDLRAEAGTPQFEVRARPQVLSI